jgi:hypothetical protein
MRRCRPAYLASAAALMSVVVSSCGGASPSSSSGTPTPSPSPTAEPTPVSCGEPKPPAISRMNAKVHLIDKLYWTLDSTPLVGPNRDYCAAIGFTDARSFCPVRPEGHPERAVCEAEVVGLAEDTGRTGPTWTRNGQFCTGINSGCENDPDNQYALRVYWQGQGDYKACAKNGVCGEVFARGPK